MDNGRSSRRTTDARSRTPSFAEARVATLLPHPAQAAAHDWSQTDRVCVDLDWNVAHPPGG